MTDLNDASIRELMAEIKRKCDDDELVIHSSFIENTSIKQEACDDMNVDTLVIVRKGS